MPISLGQITFGIGADTTQLRQSITDITNFGTAVEQAAANANTAGTAVEAAFRRQEAAMISALQKVQRYQDAVRNLQAPTQLTQGLNQLSTRALDQMTARMTSGQLSAIQYQREMERFNQTMGNAQRIMKNWTAAQQEAEKSSMAASLQKLSSAAVLVYGPLSGVATRISVVSNLADHFSIAWAGAIGGIAAGSYAFLKFSEAAVGVERSLQNISSTLQAVYGNQTIANLQMSYLQNIAQRTGVSFDVLAKQYAQIEAAAKGTSLEGERVQKVFESIAFAGTKLGLSNDELRATFLAIQQMISKGTIQMQELKTQLGNDLPGAMQIMASALGVTTTKLQTMITQGQVGASNLTKFADALTKRYNIDTSQKIDTLAAAEGRLQTARVAAIDSLDKIIGISSAYKNTVNNLADALTGVSNNARQFIQQLLQVAAALAAAFAAPLIQSGVTALTQGIIGLSRALAAVNAASALSALTSFGRVLAVLAVAVGAYYASGSLIDKALGDTQKSFLQATPAVEDYIKAQQNLVSTVRGPTQEYIKQQEELLKVQQNQRDELAKQGQVVQGYLDLAEKMGASSQDLDKMFQSGAGAQVVTKLQAADAAIAKTKQNIASLTDILKKQTEAEDKPRKDPEKDLTTRQETTIAKAKEQVRDLKAQYDALFLSPAAKQYADTQEQINHSIEQFKENLQRAEIPAGTIAKLVQQYSVAVRNMKEGEVLIKNQVSAFVALSDVFGKGLTTGVNNFVDAMVEGKDKLQSFQDTVKAIYKDLLNTFLKLAAIAPLKNYLFGTNDQVLGGNAGIGGALGGLFGGFGGGAQAASSTINVGNYVMPRVGFRDGGVMTSQGPVPLRRYAGGGITAGAQAAIFGEGTQREAFVPLPDGRRIPVSMQGGPGGQPVEFHVHESPSTKAQVSTSTGKNGGMRIDVHLREMARGLINEDIANGGPISRSFEKQYGLNRAKGLSR